MRTEDLPPDGTGQGTCFGAVSDPGPRVAWYLLALAVFTMFFNLWGRAIEKQDYVRYAEVAREIIESGEWLILRHNGEYYADKPPFHFWKIAGAYELFGVNAGAARVPSAAFAVLGAMLAYFYGARVLRSRTGGLTAALFLLGSYGYFWWGRRTRIDMEFGMLVSLALVSFHVGWEAGGAKRWWSYALFWGATGLAFLDKAFIAFSSCAVVLVWVGVNLLIKTPALRARFGPAAFFATLPVVLVPIVPWALAVYFHPECKAYWDAFVAKKIMGSHEWLLFYVHAVPTYLLPWSPLLLLGVWECIKLRKDPARPRELAFVLTWAGTIFFMLNLTSVKDHRYLLPLYVPCQIVAAWAALQLARRCAARCVRILPWIDRACAVAALIACVVAIIIALSYHYAITLSFLTASVLAAALFVFRRHAPFPVARLCVSVLILFHAIEACAVSGNERGSPRLRMANVMRAKGLTGDALAVLDTPDSDRARTVLSFYFNRLLACDKDLDRLLSDARVRAIIMDKAAGERLRADPGKAMRGDILALDAREADIVVFVKTND